MVSSRYRAYRDFMAPRGGGLTLEAWFRFYRLEKQSESPGPDGRGGERLLGDGRGDRAERADQPGAFFAILGAARDRARRHAPAGVTLYNAARGGVPERLNGPDSKSVEG